jgi:hypothetical protein
LGIFVLLQIKVLIVNTGIKTINMKPFSSKTRHTRIIQIDQTNHGDNKKDIGFKDDFLNINSIDLDLTESIFRIFNFDYFINDFRDNKLTLVRPHKWQDPFENFLLNSVGVMDDGTEVGFENVRDLYYSQCWSLKEECDGLWRNYKGENDFAIKIKTTTRKLFDLAYDINYTFHNLSYFIGMVEYVSDDEIVEFFKNKVDFSDYQSGLEFAQTMLIKRKSFGYEEEVRLIIRDKTITNSDLLRIPINMNDLVEEIVFDPWIKPDVYEQKRNEIIALGYTGKITRSSLYDKPFFKVKL